MTSSKKSNGFFWIHMGNLLGSEGVGVNTETGKEPFTVADGVGVRDCSDAIVVEWFLVNESTVGVRTPTKIATIPTTKRAFLTLADAPFKQHPNWKYDPRQPLETIISGPDTGDMTSWIG